MQQFLERVLKIEPKKTENVTGFVEHVAAVHGALLEATGDWLGIDAPVAPADCDYASCWQGAGRNATVTLWRSPGDHECRMLKIDLVDERPTSAAQISLEAGGNATTGLWLHEIQRVMEPAMAPDALAFVAALKDFVCTDRDGLRTGVALTSNAQGKARLIGMIRKPRSERSLPVIVVSRRAREVLIDTQMLAARLAGLARVAVIGPDLYWSKEDLHHTTYGGAVRIYAAGYRDEDAEGEHPFKAAGAIKAMVTDALMDWAVDFVLDHTLRLQWRAPGIEQVQRTMEQERLLAAVRAGEQATEEQLQKLIDDQNNKTDGIAAERDYYKAELEDAQDEIERLNVKLRGLEAGRAPAPSLADEENANAGWSAFPQLLLSAPAKKVCDGLDKRMLREVETKIFSRIMDAEHRNSNVDQAAADQGDYLVYPRSGAANGMRVFMRVRQDNVYLLELFTDHDTYDAFRRTTHGKRLNEKRYREADFVPWTSESPPCVEAEEEE